MKWLEVLHALVRDKFESKSDCLVSVLHCMMINKGNKIVGIGDEWKDRINPSDMLPHGWNSNKELYTLQYISPTNKAKYLMKIVKVNDCLLVNLMDVGKNKAAGMSVKIDDHITDNYKTYAEAYKNLEKIEKDFERDILQAIQASDSPPLKTKTKKEEPIPDENAFMTTIYEDHIRNQRPIDILPGYPAFPSLGRNDLDPLGGYFGQGSSSGVGGGMLMDPRFSGPMRSPGIGPSGLPGVGPLGLPRGAVPPGARFDPFSPLGPGRRSGPDPDHMLPPGYGDSFI